MHLGIVFKIEGGPTYLGCLSRMRGISSTTIVIRVVAEGTRKEKYHVYKNSCSA